MYIVNLIADILLIIGALNWAFIGITDANFITLLVPLFAYRRIIYIVIGIAAIWKIISYFLVGKEKPAVPIQ